MHQQTMYQDVAELNISEGLVTWHTARPPHLLALHECVARRIEQLGRDLGKAKDVAEATAVLLTIVHFCLQSSHQMGLPMDELWKDMVGQRLNRGAKEGMENILRKFGCVIALSPSRVGQKVWITGGLVSNKVGGVVERQGRDNRVAVRIDDDKLLEDCPWSDSADEATGYLYCYPREE